MRKDKWQILNKYGRLVPKDGLSMTLAAAANLAMQLSWKEKLILIEKGKTN